MRHLTGFILLASTLLFSAGASAKMNFACSYKSGPGQVQITVLEATQFSVFYKGPAKTVYSCGPFINDGSVVVDDKTAIVELVSDSCDHFPDGNVTQLIYCY